MKFYEQDEYQEKCFALFLELQSEISAVLPSAQIEHIGSSSVPGAISKGDLDIYVGVDPQAHESAVLALIDCGYRTFRGKSQYKRSSKENTQEHTFIKGMGKNMLGITPKIQEKIM